MFVRETFVLHGRYGPQPVFIILRDRFVKIHPWVRAHADELGGSPKHIYNAFRGVTPPSPTLRKRLPKVMDLPLASLFTPEALTATYEPSRAVKRRVA